MLAVLPAAAVLLHHWTTTGALRTRAFWLRSAAPVLAVLLPATLASAAYNRAVTGDPWRMPYQVWLEQQGLSTEAALTATWGEGAGGASVLESANRVNDGFWRHAALVTDGVSQTLYLDGAQVGTETGITVSHSSMTSNQVGVGLFGFLDS